jgi:TetR/AcrR family transcriptional regulator, cholesterol catabolism regulator
MQIRTATKRSKPPKVTDQGVKNPILLRERRAALVQAAVDVFYDKGFHACRVSDVAEAAGISPGSIYNYVRSKEDLLFLVCEDHLKRYRDAVAEALESASTPADKLTALLNVTVKATARYRKHYAVMLREIHHVEKSKRRSYMKLAADQRKACEDVLIEAGITHTIPEADVRTIANLILFLPSFMAGRGWDLREGPGEAQVSRILMEFMERGLGLAAPPLLANSVVS